MTVRIGRVRGIPVEIHISWIVVFALVTYGIGMGYVARVHPDLGAAQAVGVGAVAALLFFACLVAHEFAHAFAAVRCGLGVGSITLFLFGGVAQLKREPENWAHELGIALAGPAASLAIAVSFAVLWVGLGRGLGATVAFYLALSNLLVAAVNMLPGLPLDGGRVLRALLWRLLGGRMAATRAAALAGRGIGLAVALFGAAILVLRGDVSGIWFAMIGWFVSDAAAGSWEHERLRGCLRGIGAMDLITRRPVTLAPEATLAGALGEPACARGTDIWPVADGRGPVGVLTGSRASGVPEKEWQTRTVGDVMSPLDGDMLAGPDEDAWEVVERLWERRDLVGVIVAQAGRVLGVVGQRELPGVLAARLAGQAAPSR